jgi:CRP-like cAMP-binding protein
MTQLIQQLHSIHPLSVSLREHLYSILKTAEVSKKDRLLKAGHVCSNIYFIEKGIFRCSYLEKSREVCSWFMKEGNVIISVASFFKQKPSHENIIAMEDGLVHYISYNDLQLIYRRYKSFNFIGRVLTENYYTMSEERMFALKMRSAKDRYRYLLEHQSDLIQRVPSTYIASYLGISLETLSRLKRPK